MTDDPHHPDAASHGPDSAQPIGPAPLKPNPFSVPNVRLFVAFRVLFNARFYYPVFTIIFLDFGLTLEQFAILNSIWAATIVLAEVPSGALADIVGRRNLVIFSAAIMVVEMAVLVLVPLGNNTLIFAAFLVNRILSGLAEAAASGADEALAFDSLKEAALENQWPVVLERLMRYQSIGFFIAMISGAAVYDPALMSSVLSLVSVQFDDLSRESTMRLPIYLTLATGIITLGLALRMRDVSDSSQDASTVESPRNNPSERSGVQRAFAQTLKAAQWVLKTPFALVVILAGLLFDSFARMFVTLASEYYRVIDLPEASFGLIGSTIALIGLLNSRICRHLAETRTPFQNLIILSLILLLGLTGCAFAIPYAGLVFAVLVFSVMGFCGFFLSHYLNRVTPSEKRATVLSFRGLALNLGYGLAGLAYSGLVASLRNSLPPNSEHLQETIFIRALTAFPTTFILFLALFILLATQLLKNDTSLSKIS